MNRKNNYQVCYREVKYFRIEVSKEGVRLIVPQRYPVRVEEVIESKRNWIQKKIRQLRELENISRSLTLYDYQNLEEMVGRFVKDYGDILKIMPGKILFRKMKNRWGSCHSKNKSLIFNRKLKALPEELIRYVVLHEMCHLLVRNHRKDFWLLVEKLDEKFEEKERLLLSYNLKLARQQEQNAHFLQKHEITSTTS